MIPTDGDWTVIFNSQAVQWGSFRYKSADDALRHLCAELNSTETVFPGTNLRLAYELVASQIP